MTLLHSLGGPQNIIHSYSTHKIVSYPTNNRFYDKIQSKQFILLSSTTCFGLKRHHPVDHKNKKNTYAVCVCVCIYIYRVSQEERAKLRKGVPYVKLYRYNPKHLYPKLNGYGDNGHRKVWASGVSTYCTPSVTP